jgi:hypothetical protein
MCSWLCGAAGGTRSLRLGRFVLRLPLTGGTWLGSRCPGRFPEEAVGEVVHSLKGASVGNKPQLSLLVSSTS